MANQLSKPQYAWKQDGIMKKGWFPDKETCLNHCEQHKSDGDVYLYKRVVIPDGWTPSIMKSNYESFRWEVEATPLHKMIGPWFQSTKNCLYHFKKKLEDGFDVPIPTYYLVMRRCLDNEKD